MKDESSSGQPIVPIGDDGLGVADAVGVGLGVGFGVGVAVRVGVGGGVDGGVGVSDSVCGAVALDDAVALETGAVDGPVDAVGVGEPARRRLTSRP